MNEKIYSDVYKKVDKLIKEKSLLISINFKGITPWWGGNYEGRTSDKVNETEILGRLRWFLRTVYNRFCVSDLTSYKEAESKVSMYLGNTKNKSIYTFKVKNTKIKNGLDYSKLQRVKLIESKQKSKDYEPKDLEEFTLQIYRNPNKSNKYDEIISNGVLITLAFLGIGKGANRGFGRFYPKDCKGLSICDEVNKGDVKGVFNKFYEIFKKVENCNKSNQWVDSAVPLAPLVKEGADSITEINCVIGNIRQILDIIQGSVLKSYLKVNSYNINIRDPGPFIHTWIYGLPRHSKVPESYKKDDNKIKVDQSKMNLEKDDLQIEDEQVKELKLMGYFELIDKKLKEPRRQSMFVISPVFFNNSYKIYVIPFLSLKDNEEEAKRLVHKGIHFNKNTIHLVGVQDILNMKTNSNFKPYFKNKILIDQEVNLAKRKDNLSFGNPKDLIESYKNELISNINKQCLQYYKQ